VARTDRGTAVTLYHVAASALSDSDIHDAEREIGANFPRTVITAAPTLAHNCHGWIFAGGRYWVSQEDVETILHDNGYHEVAAPAPSDVVIYRGATGLIAHSGLVRATTEGRVEVESKWGYMHRVRHEVAAQPFGERWAFYHSERPGHLIHLGDSDASGASDHAE
jgi:hypothetical protein